MRAASQEDYLIRLIRQMVQMLRRISGLKEAGNLDEALRETDDAIQTLLGPATDTLVVLDPFTAARVIGDPERVLLWARVLSQRAEILELQGGGPAASGVRQRALALAHEAVRGGVSDPSAAASLIEGLSRRSSSTLSHVRSPDDPARLPHPTPEV